MLVVGGGCWCALAACVQSGIFRKCWFNVQNRCENWKNIVMLLSNANNSALHKTTTTKSSASARTIQIDWCRDYYSFKCPSNKGTQFGSIGEHLEWNNGSRIAGDGFFFSKGTEVVTKAETPTKTIQSNTQGWLSNSMLGQILRGSKSKKERNFMQIWSTWKTRSPVDFLHKAQKWVLPVDRCGLSLSQYKVRAATPLTHIIQEAVAEAPKRPPARIKLRYPRPGCCTVSHCRERISFQSNPRQCECALDGCVPVSTSPSLFYFLAVQ